MRRTMVPPRPRAKNQLNRAVRAPPTCRYPVGEGANLTRISPAGFPGALEVVDMFLAGLSWQRKTLHLSRSGSGRRVGAADRRCSKSKIILEVRRSGLESLGEKADLNQVTGIQ